MEDGGEGVPEVVVTGRSIFGGVKEEVSGSSVIVQRGDDRQEVRNAPINDDRPVMRVEI